jgi:hypothetical protein
MSRSSEARRRRRLARGFQREAAGLYQLDIVDVADRVFAPAIVAWAAGVLADDPALCLLCAGPRFGPGHGLPKRVAFLRAFGATVAMAGGICAGCARRGDLEGATLDAFGFVGRVRVIDPVHLHRGGQA